jgi:hypothetical protein
MLATDEASQSKQIKDEIPSEIQQNVGASVFSHVAAHESRRASVAHSMQQASFTDSVWLGANSEAHGRRRTAERV